MQNQLPQNLYYWKVKALDSGKNPISAWATYRNFTLNDILYFDPAPTIASTVVIPESIHFLTGVAIDDNGIASIQMDVTKPNGQTLEAFIDTDVAGLTSKDLTVYWFGSNEIYSGVVGVYSIELTVTGNSGLTVSDTFSVTVSSIDVPLYFNIDYPVVGKSDYIPGSYGGRSFYYNNVHIGEDINLKEEAPIRAIADGKIVWYSFATGYATINDGTSIVAVIEHDLGRQISLDFTVGHSKTKFFRCFRVHRKN